MGQSQSPLPIPWSDLHARLHRELRQRSLLPAHSSLWLAVSGGQDSVALLRLLLDLQPHWSWTLQVVHCDHGWRPDSGQNAAFVADLCQGWGVPCQVIQADQPRLKEAAARQWRYGVQAAWYSWGLEQATGIRPSQFIFIAVEKKAPYAVACYAADEEMIQLGMETAMRDLQRIAECRTAERWPGYSDQIEMISLPNWLRPRPDGSTQQPPEIAMY